MNFLDFLAYLQSYGIEDISVVIELEGSVDHCADNTVMDMAERSDF